MIIIYDVKNQKYGDTIDDYWYMFFWLMANSFEPHHFNTTGDIVINGYA
jgi:hypothetical protein